MTRAAERGYAVIAAVLAAAAFAMVAAQVARTSRSEILGVNAGLVHARLDADAAAGLALAVDHVAADDPAARWDIDGQTHDEAFDGARLTITVEDERGKIPLGTLSQAQARLMFEAAGAAPDAVEPLVQAFLDWRDPNRQAAAIAGASPKVNGFRKVEELALLAGMTPEVYAAIAPFATVEAGDKPFDPRTAHGLALQVMQPAGAGAGGAGPAGYDAIVAQRERAGERPALSPPVTVDLVNRALTIRVDADDAQGGHVRQATIVELTGRPDRPYIVRQRVE